MADPTFHILKAPFYPPATDAPLLLGRIVQNYAAPYNAFTPSNPSPFITLPLLTGTLTSASRLLSSSSNTSLSTQLLNIAKYANSNTSSSSTNIETASITSLQLQQHAEVYSSLMTDPAIKEKVTDWTKHAPVYLIVGALIWDSANITESESSSHSHTIGGNIPVDTIVTGALGSQGIVIPTGDLGIGNVGAERGKGGEQKFEQTGKSEGRKIFAVQYRVIKRKLFYKVVMEDEATKAEGGRKYGRLEPRTFSVMAPVKYSERFSAESSEEGDSGAMVAEVIGTDEEEYLSEVEEVVLDDEQEGRRDDIDEVKVEGNHVPFNIAFNV